jgi:hypothetical protein
MFNTTTAVGEDHLLWFEFGETGRDDAFGGPARFDSPQCIYRPRRSVEGQEPACPAHPGNQGVAPFSTHSARVRVKSVLIAFERLPGAAGRSRLLRTPC